MNNERKTTKQDAKTIVDTMQASASIDYVPGYLVRHLPRDCCVLRWREAGQQRCQSSSSQAWKESLAKDPICAKTRNMTINSWHRSS